jgi:hypothetical protein
MAGLPPGAGSYILLQFSPQLEETDRFAAQVIDPKPVAAVS